MLRVLGRSVLERSVGQQEEQEQDCAGCQEATGDQAQEEILDDLAPHRVIA
jgi:hypothetical protein